VQPAAIRLLALPTLLQLQRQRGDELAQAILIELGLGEERLGCGSTRSAAGGSELATGVRKGAVERPGGLEQAGQMGQRVAEFVWRDRRQGSTRPDAVIGHHAMQLLDAADPHRLAAAPRGDPGLCQAGIEGRHHQPLLAKEAEIVAFAAVRLQQVGARWQQRQKRLARR